MKVFGLLGGRLSYSYSPQIHKMLAGYDYELIEKNPCAAEAFLKQGGFDGINVTMPYKKLAFDCCAQTSDIAKRLGNVNTVIRRTDGTLYGDNTDYFGAQYVFQKHGVEISGKKAVVLGSGSASNTIQAVLKDGGAAGIAVISRQGAQNYGSIARHYDAHLLINATPVGSYPGNGECLIDVSGFSRLEFVFDLVYNPAHTKLLSNAADCGINRASGLSMLVAQAKKAAELFTGEKIAEEKIDEVSQSVLKRTMNIALIGMPGCGKSTIGKILAARTGRVCYDTDMLAEKTAGMSVAEIFSKYGEEKFRALETDALKEAAKKSGAIIAAGGGAVTREINRSLFRQNSVVIYLRRDINQLPKDNRPLSQQNDLRDLYEKRKRLYETWCDIALDCGQTPQDTAQKILEELDL